MASPVASSSTVESVKNPEVSSTQSAQSPLVVDIGKKSRKQVRQLRDGEGKLLAEVSALIEQLRTSGSIHPLAQPVIVVVREKRKARSLLWPVT
jgi:hypothetical protein